MTVSDYLDQILASQTLPEDGDELEELRSRRKNVEDLLLTAFPKGAPTIRYGGSMAKGTMIRAAYDLDVISYFPHDSEGAGATLEEIYNNVRKALETSYSVESKASALRLRGTGSDCQLDFHVDVVPGRYVDDKKSDVFLYQASGDKKRLKTNLQVHIDHVRESGFRDAIRLMKYWRYRNGLTIKHFVLELLTIELLKVAAVGSLETQLLHVWTKFRDEAATLAVQDPANPTGNDLTAALDAVRTQMSTIAGSTLSTIETLGWESVYGKVDTNGGGSGGKLASLERAAAVITRPPKPWRDTP
jgi:hypothetical protein